MIWWIFPAAVGFFGVVLALTGLARFGKLKVFSGGFRVLGGGLVVAVAALFSMVGMNLQTYSRLTHERPVAIVDLDYVEPQVYSASVLLDGEDVPKTYELRGDEIEFKARIIKWTPWANILGYDAIYRLDRMAGQYNSIEEDLEKPRTVYPLRLNDGLDAFGLVQQRGGWLKAVDAYYGSGTYVPMVPGASYEIIMTQNGLISRPANDPARQGLRNWRPPASEVLDVTVQAARTAE